MNRAGNDHAISLRPCRYVDIGQVYVIERESFLEDPYSSNVFLDFLMLAREGFIVACSGDSVIGYVIGTDRGNDGMIQSMAVIPSFRRKGVGTRLMKSVIGHLSKKHQRISLLVDVSNEAAISMYRKFSFSETGRVIEAYYPNGNDAIEMAWGAGSNLE
jgi:ribosomal-protein-alanine N-acetyltransferase